MLNERREGELRTYSRGRTYELYVRSRWVLCYVTGDHQQIMFVDGHVCKLTKKIKSCDFFICKNSRFRKCETGERWASFDDPAKKKVTIVVSPLKRVQKSHADAFKYFGIRAVAINEDSP